MIEFEIRISDGCEQNFQNFEHSQFNWKCKILDATVKCSFTIKF